VAAELVGLHIHHHSWCPLFPNRNFLH
jgi:hypothetical protein